LPDFVQIFDTGGSLFGYRLYDAVMELNFMTRNNLPFVIMVILSGASCSTARAQEAEQATAEIAGYQLIWSDEFNIDGPPNPANWTSEHGFVRNDELQWYQAQNATCRDGLLVIEARRERVANPAYAPGARDWRKNREFAEYTSACILTRGKHQWKYGKLLMRGRIDVRPGLWPAFWTLGTERGWPGCGEIDVMEYYAGTLLANVAWQGRRWQAVWDEAKYPIADFGNEWADRFHIWELDWNREAIRISVDGRVLNETSLDKAVNEVPAGTQPFHEPHYILLNLAIGGTRGGDPSKTEFPARFEVDYVRVYQDNAQTK
jgi:beta-glucanase (GH16 family)